MKKIKCYGRKKERPAERSAYKAIFDEESSQIKKLETQPYNLRIKKNKKDEVKVQKKGHVKEILEGSLFKSFSFVSENVSKDSFLSFEPKQFLKKNPLKTKNLRSKFKKLSHNTRCSKKLEDGFNASEEIEFSRGSKLRGSIFGPSTGPEKKISTGFSKRKLRTRPITSKPEIIKSKKGKKKKKSIIISTGLTKRKLRTRPVRSKPEIIKSKKGKKKKKSIIKPKGKNKPIDYYVEKMNENISNINQYKLTIEQQSEKHRNKIQNVVVEKDKTDSASNLENSNFQSVQKIVLPENSVFNSIDSPLNQININKENLMGRSQKLFSPTIRKKFKFSAISPLSFSNTIYKKDKYYFHKKSHTTPSKCLKELNENLSKVNAENSYRLFSQTRDPKSVLLEKKRDEYQMQNAQSLYSPIKITKELRVNLTRLDLSKLIIEDAHQSLLASQKKLKKGRKKGRKKKMFTQRKRKIKDQEDKTDLSLTTLVSTKEQLKNLTNPTKVTEKYSSSNQTAQSKDKKKIKNECVVLEEKKKCITHKTDNTYLMPMKELQVNLKRLDLSKLMSEKVNKSLSTNCNPKLKTKKKNVKITKKTVKRRKGAKNIEIKKNALPDKSTLMPPLKEVFVDLTKLDTSKLANGEVCHPPQQKTIDKNKNKENFPSTASHSLMHTKNISKTFCFPIKQLARLNIMNERAEKKLVSKETHQPSQKEVIKKNKEGNYGPSCSDSSLNSLTLPEHSPKTIDTSFDNSMERFPSQASTHPPVTSTPFTTKKKITVKDYIPLQISLEESFSRIPSIPDQAVTNTPAMKKASKRVKKFNISDISGVFSSEFSRNRNEKQEINFEYSLAGEVGKIDSRAVKSLCKKKTYLLDKVYARNVPPKIHVSNKSYSNIEKSIYLKSHSSRKEVSTEQPKNDTALDLLLDYCQQNTAIPFADVYDWKSFIIEKIGEGSYGEVFMLKKKSKKAIIKVIPLSRDPEDNLQTVDSVYSEVRVCGCLNDLRSNPKNKTQNFNLMRQAWIAQGEIPEMLLKAWDKFSDKRTTYNERPDIYDDQQLFAILELEYGGKDLSAYQLKNALEAESIFKQVVISLAIAEETNLFEHRDLHVGNILVQHTNRKKISYVLRETPISITSNGVLVNVIDFTLSRILDCGVVFYNNLANDEELFAQLGDFQFDVYRATRDQLKNQWQECLLFSNVLWMQYLCRRMLSSAYRYPLSAIHLRSMQNLEDFANILPKCTRALDIIEKCHISLVPKETDPKLIKLNSIVKYVDKRSLMK